MAETGAIDAHNETQTNQRGHYCERRRGLGPAIGATTRSFVGRRAGLIEAPGLVLV